MPINTFSLCLKNSLCLRVSVAETSFSTACQARAGNERRGQSNDCPRRLASTVQRVSLRHDAEVGTRRHVGWKQQSGAECSQHDLGNYLSRSRSGPNNVVAYCSVHFVDRKPDDDMVADDLS